MKVCVSPTNFPTRERNAMADLIERLLSYKPFRIGQAKWFGPKIYTEAADEITALLAQQGTGGEGG